MREIRIVVSRHSAFYSPLIATLAAGFLEKEGWQASYRPLALAERVPELIAAGQADVVQSAVSSNWLAMERGETNLPVHFAQINRRDGFFLVERRPDREFHWRKLEGRTLLADHAPQPLAMLKYAVRRQGAEWNRIRVLDAGSPEQMAAAFRAGGDYVHLQGPAAQQLEHEGVGSVVASVGEAMPPVAFSSLAASRRFLESEPGEAFLRAYVRARQWVRSAPPEAVAAREAVFFPGCSEAAVATAIARYQALGCWEGGAEIPRDLYERALEVFLDGGAITRCWPYEEVVVQPPAGLAG